MQVAYYCYVGDNEALNKQWTVRQCIRWDIVDYTSHSVVTAVTVKSRVCALQQLI
jgi:hypothetical protein